MLPNILTEVQGIPIVYIPAHVKNTWGADEGLHAKSCEGVVEHIMVGNLGGCIGWFQNPESGASANFGIGLRSIVQFVPLYDDAPFANGSTNEAGMSPGVRAKYVKYGRASQNKWTWSIEHEGQSGDKLTPFQFDASTKLTALLLSVLPPERRGIFGHFEFDSVNRGHCPGWSDLQWAIYRSQVVQLLSVYDAPVASSDIDWVKVREKLDIVWNTHWEAGQRLTEAGRALSEVYMTIREVKGDF